MPRRKAPIDYGSSDILEAAADLQELSLNAHREGAHPRRSPARGWAPTAIREILRRELYRGVIVWNRSQKVIRKGTKGERWRPPNEWMRIEAPELGSSPRISGAPSSSGESAWRPRSRGVTHDDRHLARPSGADLDSPYLLSGLAQCAACGGSLVAMTRAHGPRGARHRVPFYGCIYHHKRGDVVCKNDVVIRQQILDAAFLDALAEALDERLIARAIEKAVTRAQRGREATDDRRTELLRERSRVEGSIRNLVDAVKLGRATETLLAELQTQEERQKAIGRELAGLDGRARVVPIDAKRMRANSKRGREISARTSSAAARRRGGYCRGSWAARGSAVTPSSRLIGAATGLRPRARMERACATTLVAPTGFEPAFQLRP